MDAKCLIKGLCAWLASEVIGFVGSSFLSDGWLFDSIIGSDGNQEVGQSWRGWVARAVPLKSDSCPRSLQPLLFPLSPLVLPTFFLFPPLLFPPSFLAPKRGAHEFHMPFRHTLLLPTQWRHRLGQKLLEPLAKVNFPVLGCLSPMSLS